MDNATHQGPGAITEGAGAGRRFNIGGMPAAPTALWLLALLLVSAAVASSWYTIHVARLALRNTEVSGAWIDVVAALLGLASVMVVLP
jgi:hypothetical protein